MKVVNKSIFVIVFIIATAVIGAFAVSADDTTAPVLTAETIESGRVRLTWTDIGTAKHVLYYARTGDTQYTMMGSVGGTGIILNGFHSFTSGEAVCFIVRRYFEYDGGQELPPKLEYGAFSNAAWAVPIPVPSAEDIARQRKEAARQKFEPVLTDIQNSFRKEYGEVAIGFTDLSTGYTYVTDSEFRAAASVIKLYIAKYVYSLVADGRAALTDNVGGYSLKYNIEQMITVSDNEATTRIVAHYGIKNIQAWIAERYPDTDLNSWQGVALATPRLIEHSSGNVTTPSDTLQILQDPHSNADPHSGELIAVMRRQQLVSKIPKYIRDIKGVYVANKTGSFVQNNNPSLRVQNDAGLVYTPGGNFAIVFFAEDVPEEYEQTVTDLMAKASKQLVETVMA